MVGKRCVIDPLEKFLFVERNEVQEIENRVCVEEVPSLTQETSGGHSQETDFESVLGEGSVVYYGTNH